MKFFLDMGPVIIPSKVTKGEELVVLSRKDYERLAQKPQEPLDRNLAKALADVRAGRFFGPFDNMRAFKRSIERRRA